MLKVKMNEKNNPVYAKQLWKCDACLSLDSQSHLMWCPAFAIIFLTNQHQEQKVIFLSTKFSYPFDSDG